MYKKKQENRTRLNKINSRNRKTGSGNNVKNFFKCNNSLKKD